MSLSKYFMQFKLQWLIYKLFYSPTQFLLRYGALHAHVTKESPSRERTLSVV